MDRHISTIKRNRQNIRRRLRNRSKRTFLRNQIKEIRRLFASKDFEKASLMFNKLTKVIDQSAAKNLVHKNTAARYKSNLARQLNSIAPPKGK